VILAFAIGLVKYTITSHFFGDRWNVSRKKAFAIIMVDSAIFAIILIGATPIDISSFLPIADAFRRLSESIGILIFYLSLNHPILFRNLINAAFLFPLLYPISVLINAQLYGKSAQFSDKITLLQGRWQLASVSALIAPLCICIVIFIAATPLIMKSKVAINATFEDAVVDANVDMAAALLRQGASVNAKSRYGGSVLYTAFAFGRMPRAGTPISIVKFLIDNGADINAVGNENGETILMGACDGYGRIEEFKLLLDRQPNFNAVDNEGNNALYYALRRRQIDKAALVIARGVDINRKNNHGYTVLMDAAEKGYMDVVQFLLDNRADIGLKDSCGRTALRIAVQGDHKEVAELIRAGGGDPNDMVKKDMSCGKIVSVPIDVLPVQRRSVQEVGRPPEAAPRINK